MTESIEEAINKAVYDLIKEAEEKFGPRDNSYELLKVEFMEIGGPKILISGKQAIIYLSKKASLDFADACQECAHEVVHLLGPQSDSSNGPTFLEEGVATYFQAHIYSKFGRGYQTASDDYDAAWTYAAALLNFDNEEAIKKLREFRPVLSEITKEDILEIYPDFDPEIAEELETPFPQMKILECRPPYTILKGSNLCWSCGKEFDAVGIVVGEALVEEDFSEKVYIMYAKELPDELLHEIQAITPNYCKEFTATTEMDYFANVCPYCGEVTGDHFLFSEPDGAFGPGKEESPTGVKAHFDKPMAIETSFGMRGGLP
ncbi:hypothetical protein EG832_05150 [bacterium]|nr:hypothetical protein [bacterium]